MRFNRDPFKNYNSFGNNTFKKKSFDPFSLMFKFVFPLFFAAIIGLIVFNVVLSANGDHKQEAESQAAQWSTQMGLNVKSIMCAKADTDGDGYVSCTVAENTANGTQLHSIECTGRFSINDGCRAPKINMLGLRGY